MRSRPQAAPRRWCRSPCADTDGIARLALALNERYQRLDVLDRQCRRARAACRRSGMSSRGLGRGDRGQCHRQFPPDPHAWTRCCAPLRAGRAVFVTSGAATNTRAYRGPYSVTKAALNALALTYAAETVTTNVRVNLINPGPTRTRMRAAAMPGEDPMSVEAGRDGGGEDRRDVPAGFPGDRQALRLREGPSARRCSRRREDRVPARSPR